MATDRQGCFSAVQRTAIARWSEDLPLGLRASIFAAAGQDDFEKAVVFDRDGNGLYLLSSAEGPAHEAVTLIYPDDSSEGAASVERALAMILEWERNHLTRPRPKSPQDVADATIPDPAAPCRSWCTRAMGLPCVSDPR